jgi:RNA-directed DNA polymerase
VAEVMKAQHIIATWLKDIGLELKSSKTRLFHTLKDYQGNQGFDFLGFTIRQFPVGKTHTGSPMNEDDAWKAVTETARKMPMV